MRGDYHSTAYKHKCYHWTTISKQSYLEFVLCPLAVTRPAADYISDYLSIYILLKQKMHQHQSSSVSSAITITAISPVASYGFCLDHRLSGNPPLFVNFLSIKPCHRRCTKSIFRLGWSLIILLKVINSL